VSWCATARVEAADPCRRRCLCGSHAIGAPRAITLRPSRRPSQQELCCKAEDSTTSPRARARRRASERGLWSYSSLGCRGAGTQKMSVVPAQAGIHFYFAYLPFLKQSNMDSRLRGNDGRVGCSLFLAPSALDASQKQACTRPPDPYIIAASFAGPGAPDELCRITRANPTASPPASSPARSRAWHPVRRRRPRRRSGARRHRRP